MWNVLLFPSSIVGEHDDQNVCTRIEPREQIARIQQFIYNVSVSAREFLANFFFVILKINDFLDSGDDLSCADSKVIQENGGRTRTRYFGDGQFFYDDLSLQSNRG